MMRVLKTLAYKTIDLATFQRGIKRNIGGAEIRFPSRLCRFYRSDYESRTVEYLKQNLKPGDVFFDVGAHMGLFSVLGAQLVGRKGIVVSFEPTMATRLALEDVVRINRCTDVVAIRKEAISSESGTAVFFNTGDLMSVTNSLLRNDTTTGEVRVPTISLDEFVTDSGHRPDLIKIDVEGAEFDVLVGAAETLKNLRPKVMLSVHPPFFQDRNLDLERIWTILQTIPFDIKDFDGNLVSKTAFFANDSFFEVLLFPR